MAGKATITYYDMRGRPTSMSVNTVEPSAANLTALTGQIDALRAALNSITESTEINQTLSVIDQFGTPANRGGLRGTKALVRWFASAEGDGGQFGSNEIGCVDATEFTVVGDKAILQGALYNALKAAFDAVVLTENGASVAVYEVELVSRSI